MIALVGTVGWMTSVAWLRMANGYGKKNGMVLVEETTVIEPDGRERR